MFYPGTLTVDQATPTKVDLDAASLASISRSCPTAAHRVTGIVLDSSGKPARATVLLAVSERSGAIQTEAGPQRCTGADGSFAFNERGAW